MTGSFPLRRYNVGYGTYPKKGWLKENQWDGIIPNDELPTVVNPERGYVVSANNLATTKHIKHGLSHAFAFPHRFLRLSNMIQSKIDAGQKMTFQDMIDMQMDVFDIQANHSLGHMISSVKQAKKQVLEVIFDSKAQRDKMNYKINNVLDLM